MCAQHLNQADPRSGFGLNELSGLVRRGDLSNGVSPYFSLSRLPNEIP